MDKNKVAAVINWDIKGYQGGSPLISSDIKGV